MKELPRRLWHIFGGLCIPASGLLVAENIFLPALISIAIAALIVEIVRLRSPQVNRRFVTAFRALLREREVSTPTGSTYLFIAASIVFVLCDKSIAAIALAFVVVGDPVAGMVGERRGRLRVNSEKRSGHGRGAFWLRLRRRISNFARSLRNLRFRKVVKGKSLEGSFACFAACLVVGVVLAAVTHIALWVVVLGAICATVMESLSLPVNDNLSIPLVAAGVMSLVYAIMV
jgi:dolichol kinase